MSGECGCGLGNVCVEGWGGGWVVFVLGVVCVLSSVSCAETLFILLRRCGVGGCGVQFAVGALLCFDCRVGYQVFVRGGVASVGVRSATWEE